MKLLYTFLLSCLILSLISCSNQSEVNLEEQREQVMELIDNFVKAHEEKDLDMLLSCFSDQPDIIILGTDADELWVDKISMGEAQKRAYKTFDKVSLSVRDKLLKMCSTGKQAWFYMKVNWYVESGDEKIAYDDIRTTGVVQKEEGNWAIVMIHTSLPVEGQAVRY
jgi:hypothetical protein